MAAEHMPNRRVIIIEHGEGCAPRLRNVDGGPCSIEDIALLEAALEEYGTNLDSQPCPAEEAEPGYVYLLSGPEHQKIGKSGDPASRHRNLGLLMPWKIHLEHYIETDYMSKLEKYWHYRFKAKRQNGEWFKLSDRDISFFCSFKQLSLSSRDCLMAISRLYTVDIINVLTSQREKPMTLSSLMSLEKEVGPWSQGQIKLARYTIASTAHLSYLDGEYSEVLSG